MTKCIVIGEQPTESKKKPIEFVKYIDVNGGKNKPDAQPKDWKNIERIASKFRGMSYSLMYAYDNNRDEGALYLGHWNDGVAE